MFNWIICFFIQVAALYKVWEVKPKAEKSNEICQLLSIAYIVPYLAITITCNIALCRIRSFYKSKGMGHRIDTFKIVFHGLLFFILLNHSHCKHRNRHAWPFTCLRSNILRFQHLHWLRWFMFCLDPLHLGNQTIWSSNKHLKPGPPKWKWRLFSWQFYGGRHFRGGRIRLKTIFRHWNRRRK